MVKQFSRPGSIYAVVSDSYNIYKAVDTIWGEKLANLVRKSEGTLVIRPDSGDPVEVLPRLISSLNKNFGSVKNDKGYLVLNNVRLIWGDGINEQSIRSILRVIVDIMGFSADNIAFGMGGALLQMVNRDTQKFAMKCSSAQINGEWVDVFKEPVTDPGKTSKKGILDTPAHLIRYENGVLLNKTSFDQVRSRS
jgi:nicotinamide phosphoribosyltransferase